jgi:predicted Zn finger-like uncharacterized protein
MKITCGSCAAKYTVSDEKVQGKTVKIKCRKCGAVIVVSSSGEVQTTGGSAADAAGGASYTVSVTDSDQRTMTMGEIVGAYNEGTIDAETYVWAEGMDDWQPLKDVDAIVDALHSAASEETAEPEHDDLGSTVAMSDGAAAYGAVASSAAASPAAAAGGLDFGSTVAMSSPSQASKPAYASSADSGGGFFDFSGPAATSPAAPSGGGGEENSAIFSLNMLTQKVGGDGAPGGSTGGSEDSGLIDLKALAAGVGDQNAAVEAAPPPAEGIFPLGAPPPVAIAPAAIPSMAPQPQSSNRGLIFGLGGAVVVLAALLVFFIVKGDDPAPTAQPTPAEIKPPEPTPVAENTAQPAATSEPTAAPDSTAAPTADPKVATAPQPYRPPPGGLQPKGAPPGPAPKTAPPPPPKPAGGPCGCAPDDLMCHMRCSQKK